MTIEHPQARSSSLPTTREGIGEYLGISSKIPELVRRWWEHTEVSVVEEAPGQPANPAEFEVHVDDIADLAHEFPCRRGWSGGSSEPYPFELFCYVSTTVADDLAGVAFLNEGLVGQEPEPCHPDVVLQFGWHEPADAPPWNVRL